MKRFFKLALFLLALYYIPKFCEKQTDGFTLLKIAPTLPFNKEWEVNNSLTAELPAIFSQRFYYLASGGQCFVFVSEDDQYVVKFFKHPRKNRMRKLLRDFRSYKIAFEHLARECGLIYLHLNKTSNLHCKAKVVDKLNIEHTIDLDDVEFIVQKRADLVANHLNKLLSQNEMAKAEEAIRSIYELILLRCKKGIYDEDAKIHRNFGFIGNQAVLLDVGRLKYDTRRLDPDVQKEDLRNITRRLEATLQTISPELASYLHELTHH